MSKPLVALVGRPNVGKSTLFNRLIGQRLSVVDDQPGTTRDRIYATCEWNGVTFTLVDTGGIEPLEPLRDRSKPALAETSVGFVREIREQAEVAIAEADVVVFVVDAQAGLTASDEAVVEIIRRLLSQRQARGQTVPPVLVAASKAEAYPTRMASTEFYRLGLGEVYPVSGLHGIGTGDLLDAVVQALHERAVSAEEVTPDSEDMVRVALVGRPNVGKSSMFNRLIGENRVIVSDIPGTTRDAIDTQITFTESSDLPPATITLIDTAGIRKRGSIQRGAEKWSVLRAFKAIDRSDVALLVLDATQGITAQDEHVAGYILDEDKGAVVLVNKWDKIESAEVALRTAKPVRGMGLLTETMQEFLKVVQLRLNFMAYVPILFVSAKTGFRIEQVLPTVLRVHEARYLRVSTSDLMDIVRDAMEKHVPSRSGQRLKIFMASQVDVNPPTFVFHVNDPKLVHFTYRRFLENRIREEFTFLGTPIRMIFRGRDETD